MSFSKEKEVLADNIKIEILYPLHEIDSFNGEELKSYVTSIVDDVDGIIVNFSRITYLNSSGLRELIQILKFLKEKNKKLVFSSISDDIRKIFMHTNLDRLFTIVFKDEEAKAIISGK